MLRIFVADVFDSKIINNEAKIDGTFFVLPEDGHTLDRMASKKCQILDEFVICYPAILGESVHTAGDIRKYATIDNKVV